MTSMGKKLLHFIDGQPVEPSSNEWFCNRNPATGQAICDVASGNEEDVDRAVQAAKKALKGPWATMSLEARLKLIEAVADGIEARFDEFLEAEIADTGKPVSLASKIDIPRGSANFRFFAQYARNHPSPSFTTDTPDGAQALNYVTRAPLGVVGVISPWNLPLLLMTWKLAPALACGNTIVAKPSEETPSTATLLAEVMQQVGVPDGVYNVVHGFGPQAAGEALTRHPDVAAITFTGETRTGKAIMSAASASIKKLSFELGGKNAAVVFDDADLQHAVEGTMRSAFTNSGQVCLCTERVYVQRSIFEPFVEALRLKAKSLQMGDPMDLTTTMGPLISAQHRDKVLHYYEMAKKEGATVVHGGQIPELDTPWNTGYFVEPTIWTDLKEDAACIREEIFGPVCHVRPFDDEEEAIYLANNTDYGLCTALWTQDLTRAHRVARQMQSGIVWVNTWFTRDLRTPFGGFKQSGLGREGGTHSLDFYSELRNICVRIQS